MKLHEAIRSILIDANEALSSKDIASVINTLELYKRRDGEPVPASQITARINSYPDIFIYQNNLISLREDNPILLKEEKIKESLYNLIRQLRGTSTFSFEDITEFILTGVILYDSQQPELEFGTSFFDNLGKNSRFSSAIALDLGIQEKSVIFFSLVKKYENRYKILHKIFYWVINSLSRSRMDTFNISEDMSHIIGGLDIYQHAGLLSNSTNQTPIFLLPILERYPNREFGFMVSMRGINERVSKIKVLLYNACKRENLTDHNLEGVVHIFTPAWRARILEDPWPSEFMDVHDVLQNSNREALTNERAIVAVPDVALFGQSKRDIAARKTLTESGYLEAVITIPYITEWTPIKKASLVVLNFNGAQEKPFMADFTRAEEFSIADNWQLVCDSFNQKTNSEITSNVGLEEIIQNNYDWTPKRYLIDPIELIEEEGVKLMPLKSLLSDWYRGKGLSREGLYEKGEIKYVRVKDLQQEKDYFVLSEDTLGLDEDYLTGKERITTEGILVALIGNDIKPNLIGGENASLLIDNNVACLVAKKDLVYPEYLVKELQKDYVKEQFETYRRGSTIQHLNTKDILSILIKVPTIKVQTDLLFTSIHEVFEDDKQLGEDEISRYGKYVETLKHTLKQPLATITEDFKSVRRFIEMLELDGKISMNNLTINLPEEQNADEWESSTIGNTLKRAEKALESAHWRLEQSVQLLNFEKTKLDFKSVDLKKWLKEYRRKHLDVNTKITGKSLTARLDVKWLAIALDNMYDNARKYGFMEIENPTINLDIHEELTEEGKKIRIDYKNNGSPLDDKFTTDKFTKNGETSNQDSGDGFGGFLINRIIERHEGNLEIVPTKEVKIGDYKVHFKIYLPKG